MVCVGDLYNIMPFGCIKVHDAYCLRASLLHALFCRHAVFGLTLCLLCVSLPCIAAG
jgi:hypothetical protein